MLSLCCLEGNTVIVGMPIAATSGEYPHQLLALACFACDVLFGKKCIKIPILRVILLFSLADGDTSVLITPDAHMAHVD